MGVLFGGTLLLLLQWNLEREREGRGGGFPDYTPKKNVWQTFYRCREKQRKEATRLVSVNAKLTALNKLLMGENERLAKHTSQLTLDNHFLRRQLQQQQHQVAPIPSSNKHQLPADQVLQLNTTNSLEDKIKFC
jgi:hypothetical protein